MCAHTPSLLQVYSCVRTFADMCTYVFAHTRALLCGCLCKCVCVDVCICVRDATFVIRCLCLSCTHIFVLRKYALFVAFCIVFVSENLLFSAFYSVVCTACAPRDDVFVRVLVFVCACKSGVSACFCIVVLWYVQREMMRSACRVVCVCACVSVRRRIP